MIFKALRLVFFFLAWHGPRQPLWCYPSGSSERRAVRTICSHSANVSRVRLCHVQLVTSGENDSEGRMCSVWQMKSLHSLPNWNCGDVKWTGAYLTCSQHELVCSHLASLSAELIVTSNSHMTHKMLRSRPVKRVSSSCSQMMVG